MLGERAREAKYLYHSNSDVLRASSSPRPTALQRRMRGRRGLSRFCKPPLSRSLFLSSHHRTTSDEPLNSPLSQKNHGTDEEERQGGLDARRGRSNSVVEFLLRRLRRRRRHQERVDLFSLSLGALYLTASTLTPLKRSSIL